VSSCCTYRVGDGISSHGHFTSIQAAVNALPASGGEICVMPGVYRESVEIVNRRGIRIHGCGPRSRVVARRGPAFHILDSRDITLDSLAIVAHLDAQGIFGESSGFDFAVGMPQNRVPKLHDIKLLNLQVTAERRSAIELRNGQFIEIAGCDIRMKDVPSAWPGIFFVGDDCAIERNQVRVRILRQVDDSEITFPVPASAALGGIQIGGTSDRVRIIDNVIQGGIGNGITLGSVLVLDPNGRDTGGTGWVINIFDPCNPCKPGTVFWPEDPPGGGTRTISAGVLTEIRIERNRIFDMGLNGIGVVAFFDLKKIVEIIEVDQLSILGNHIRGCLRREIESIPAHMLDRIGYGGIALAAVEGLTIWDNIIEYNGPRRQDPVCGIFVLIGVGIDICRNHIVGNGARTEEPVTAAKEGMRGGIIIANALSPVQVVGRPDRVVQTVESNRPALRVHENIVSSPLGLALGVRGTGPISVVGNQFITQAVMQPRGGKFPLSAPASAYPVGTVLIFDLGRAFDLQGFKAGFTDISKGNVTGAVGYSVSQPAGAAATIELRPSSVALDARRTLASGHVLFVANQVTLDLIERGPTLGYSSIMILTLDDAGFLDNQSSARLADDYLSVNTVVFGFSVRASDNRWQEPIANAAYSAYTFGHMNVTAHNTATHCIVALAPPKLLVNKPNVILVEEYYDEPCRRTIDVAPNFGVSGRH
jgi:hypothetical protein